MEIVKLHIKSAAQDTAKTTFEHVSKALDNALALGKTLDETHVSWMSWQIKSALGLFMLKEKNVLKERAQRSWGEDSPQSFKIKLCCNTAICPG